MADDIDLRTDTALGVLGDRAELNAPIGPLTTYRVGGNAAILVADADIDALKLVSAASKASGLPTLVVGNGSNMLVADRGFPGMAITLGPELSEIEVDAPTSGDQVVVRVGGACPLPVVARRTAAEGLTGFEWAVGVPGTIGGAVRMNAGGHGSDISATLVEIRRFDLATGEYGPVPASDLELSYRHSNIGPSQVVTEATLRLEVGDSDASKAELSGIVGWRRENQPGGQNAGSVFTNPDDDSAGRLVDAAGLKGFRLGTAEVSTKHANFIQASADGSADDVLELIVHVRTAVHAAHGVTLTPELRLIGFSDEAIERAVGPIAVSS